MKQYEEKVFWFQWFIQMIIEIHVFQNDFLCSQGYLEMEHCLKLVNNYGMLRSLINQFLCLYNFCLSVIFTIHPINIFNIRDYWRIFWNLQLHNFAFSMLAPCWCNILSIVTFILRNIWWPHCSNTYFFSMKEIASPTVKFNVLNKW